MKIGMAAIKSSKQCGIPTQHMEALKRAAALNNTPIAIRPINPLAEHYLEDGCPTKGFKIKIKTSDRGIASGLIPISPKFSRLAHENKGDSPTLEQSMNDNPDLTTKALIVTKERLSIIKTLLGEQFHMIPAENDTDYLLSWNRGDDLIQAYALWNTANNHYDIVDEHKEPLLVLAKQINPGDTRYVTTDYDLLVICPNYKSFEPGGRDRTPFRTQGTDPTKNQLEVHKSHEKGYFGQQEKEIGKKDPRRTHSGLETVHHNAEFHNPFASDPKKNVPALMVFPSAFDLSSIAHQIGEPDLNLLKHVSEILIETTEEMTLIRDLLYTQGYYWPSHARYNHLMGPFKTEKIEATQDAVQKMQIMRAELVVIRNTPNESPIEEQQEEQSLARIAGSK